MNDKNYLISMKSEYSKYNYSGEEVWTRIKQFNEKIFYPYLTNKDLLDQSNNKLLDLTKQQYDNIFCEMNKISFAGIMIKDSYSSFLNEILYFYSFVDEIKNKIIQLKEKVLNMEIIYGSINKFIPNYMKVHLLLEKILIKDQSIAHKFCLDILFSEDERIEFKKIISQKDNFEARKISYAMKEKVKKFILLDNDSLISYKKIELVENIIKNNSLDPLFL